MWLSTSTAIAIRRHRVRAEHWPQPLPIRFNLGAALVAVALFSAAALFHERSRPSAFLSGTVGLALSPPPASQQEMPSIRATVDVSASIIGSCPVSDVSVSADLSPTYLTRVRAENGRVRAAWVFENLAVDTRQDLDFSDYTVEPYAGLGRYSDRVTLVEREGTLFPTRALWDVKIRNAQRRSAGACFVTLPGIIGSTQAGISMVGAAREAANLLDLPDRALSGTAIGETSALTRSGTNIDLASDATVPSPYSTLAPRWRCSVDGEADIDLSLCAASVTARVAGFDRWKQFIGFCLAALIALGVQMLYEAAGAWRSSPRRPRGAERESPADSID